MFVDLVADARQRDGGDVRFGVTGTSVVDVTSDRPGMLFTDAEGRRTDTVQRMYFQCSPDDSVDDWPDDRIWCELQARIAGEDGFTLKEGRIFDKAW